MTTATKCLCAFLLFCGLAYSQENQEGNSGTYQYEFEVEFVNAQTDEGMIKDIRSYAKDLFEIHPTFIDGSFKAETSFEISIDRIPQYLGVYGYNVTAVRMEKDGKVITTETSKQ